MDMDLSSGVTATEMEAVLSRTSLTATALDTLLYEGKWSCILACGAQTAGTNPTLTVKLQDCSTSDGSYADITGATFTAVSTTASTQIIGLDKKSHARYIKAVATFGGTNTPTFPFGMVAIHRDKSV